jgi:2-polyprenyl-3-methyl-5-hydroxy-6-metoxy-1,4-benzoquinol methylase
MNLFRQLFSQVRIYPSKGLFTHFLGRQRLKVIAPLMKGSILDLGCGISRITELLSPNQVYVGVDSNRSALQWMRRNHPQYDYHYLDLDNSPLQLDRRFNTILMLAVVEHLHHPQEIFSQIPTYLERNGKLLITTPTPMGDQIHRFGARLGLFASQAVDEHETIFDYQTLRKLLEANGLETISYRTFLLGGNQLFVCSCDSYKVASNIEA